MLKTILRVAVIGLMVVGTVGCSTPPTGALLPPPPIRLAVPPLTPQHQLIRSIRPWNGRVVIVTENYEYPPPSWTRDLHVVSGDAIVPLVVDGHLPLAVAENATTSFALCAEANKLLLMAKAKRAGSAWRVSDAGSFDDRSQVAHLEAGTDAVFVFVDSALRIGLSDGRWESRTTRDLLGKEWRGVPAATLATRAFLFIGYDEGEFGGGAYAIPLTAKGPNGTPRTITDYNVSAFAEGPQGEIWLGGGISHLTAEHGWLMKWQDGTATTKVDQWGDEGRIRQAGGQTAWRLDRPSEISGLAVRADGRLLLMAARVGLLEAGPKGLVTLIPGDFYVTWLEPGYGVGCFPQGIAVGDGGVIFVAMRSLGVLRFRPEGSGYRMAQLQFRTDAVSEHR